MDIKMSLFHLGTMLMKFELPVDLIDDMNKAYDKHREDMPSHNDQLAGKIADEKKVNSILSEEMKQTFQTCFDKYIEMRSMTKWDCVPGPCWINEMKSGEYNPTHFHTSLNADLGLSSVLMLKRPDTYGKEVSRPEDPSNGWLELTGGNQDPLGVSNWRKDLEPGDFIVFPYTMLHGVYPFNGTDEARRTLSYNCDLIKPEVE